MLRHIVMVKFPELSNGKTNMENAKVMKDALDALVGIIDEIRFFQCGLNEVQEDAAYDLVLVSEFESIKDLETYKIHPKHEKIRDFCKVNNVIRTVVDYSF